MAVVRKMRSPQTTGQEWPRPGIGVFQRTFLPAGTSQVVGGNCPSATPVAPTPRNCGQFSGRVTAPGASSTAVGGSSFGTDALPSTRAYRPVKLAFFSTKLAALSPT